MLLRRVQRSRALSTAPAVVSAPAVLYPSASSLTWWQIGANATLAKQFHLDRAQFAGASGGSLAAALAACGCDSRAALDVAWRLCEQIGAFERGAWAVRGMWGGLLREWLHEVLPHDAGTRCRGRVHVLVRRPLHAPFTVSDFASKDDLVSACLASVHLPWYLDGHLTAEFRGESFVDADLLSLSRGSPDLAVPDPAAPTVRLLPARDPHIARAFSRPGDFQRLKSRESVEEVMEWGARHVHMLGVSGKLSALDALRVRSERTQE